MKLTLEQLKLAQSCKSAEELLSKAQSEGFDLTPEQAQFYLGACEFSELDENKLDIVSGGCASGYTCYKCKQYFEGSPADWIEKNKVDRPICQSCLEKL